MFKMTGLADCNRVGLTDTSHIHIMYVCTPHVCTTGDYKDSPLDANNHITIIIAASSSGGLLAMVVLTITITVVACTCAVRRTSGTVHSMYVVRSVDQVVLSIYHAHRFQERQRRLNNPRRHNNDKESCV